MKNLYLQGPKDGDETLLAWYKFDDVYSGTTGQFENYAKADGAKAQYFKFVGGASTVRKGIVESEPDLTTITSETQRPLKVTIGEPHKLSVKAPGDAICSVIDDYGNDIDTQNAISGTKLRLVWRNYHVYSSTIVALNGEELIAENGVYPFAMPDQDAEITIEAIKNTTSRLTIRDFGGGCFEVSDGTNKFENGDEITVGTQLTLSAVPDEGFYLSAIKYNGSKLDTATTFIVPEHDFALYADFLELDDYNHAVTFPQISTGNDYVEDRLDIPSSMIGVSSIDDQPNAIFSVGLWVRQRVYNPTGGIMLQLAPGQFLTSTPFFGIKVDENGNLFVTNQKIKDNEIDLDVNIPLNEWHYLTFLVNMPATEITTYVDGVKKSKQNFNSIGTPTTATIGDYYLSLAALHYSADFDEIHIFDRLIDEDEIVKAYIDEVKGIPDLKGWYKFEPEDIISGTSFANHAESYGDLLATYNTFASVTNADNGYIAKSIKASTPRTDMITRQLARPMTSIDDHIISILNDEGCAIESYLLQTIAGEDIYSLLLKDEKVREKSSLRHFINLKEETDLTNILINGIEIALGGSESQISSLSEDNMTTHSLIKINETQYQLDHSVNGPTTIAIVTSKGTTSITLPSFDSNDETEVQFFNCQGIRVAPDNLCPGIYIKRIGNKTQKIFIQ